MVKITVLYDQPKDAAAFDKYYTETHVPKYGLKIPNLIKIDASRAVGEAPPYYRTADLWFKDMATLQSALGSPEGQAAVGDLEVFASGGYKVLISETETIEVAATTARR
jgi:uncharacterized protein (TIGR02118 family)